MNPILFKKSKESVSGIYAFGDSITFGMNATTGNDYVSKICTYFNVTKHNLAVSGTHLENDYPQAHTFQDDVITSYVPNKIGLVKMIIAFGTNDGRGSSGYTYFNPTKYYNVYNFCIDTLLTKGWKLNDLYIITPFYTTNADLATYGVSRDQYELFVTSCINVAIDRDITYFDSYHYTINNGGDVNISSDHVHPNNTGHNINFEGLRDILKYKIKVN